MKLTIHVDTSEEGDPQSPVPLSAFNSFERVFEEELSSLSPEFARYKRGEFSVSFLSAEEMRAVNLDYRSLDEPTDVLSFPLWEEEGGFVPSSAMTELLPLGDVLICPEELKRLHEEASFEEALCLVLAHGFLHLLAWDHDTEEREQTMWQRQDEIKKKLLAVLPDPLRSGGGC